MFIVIICIFDLCYNQTKSLKENIIYRNHFINKNFSISAFEESFDEFKVKFMCFCSI